MTHYQNHNHTLTTLAILLYVGMLCMFLPRSLVSAQTQGTYCNELDLQTRRVIARLDTDEQTLKTRHSERISELTTARLAYNELQEQERAFHARTYEEYLGRLYEQAKEMEERRAAIEAFESSVVTARKLFYRKQDTVFMPAFRLAVDRLIESSAAELLQVHGARKDDFERRMATATLDCAGNLSVENITTPLRKDLLAIRAAFTAGVERATVTARNAHQEAVRVRTEGIAGARSIFIETVRTAFGKLKDAWGG